MASPHAQTELVFNKPINTATFTTVANEKGDSIFKFPVSSNLNPHVPVPNATQATLCQQQQQQQQLQQKNSSSIELMAALNSRISPKNFNPNNVYNSVTSPKEGITSPKGMGVKVAVKTPYIKSVSDKEELHQRSSQGKRAEFPVNSNPITKKEQQVNKPMEMEQRKGNINNKYCSLTINTDIANQTEGVAVNSEEEVKKQEPGIETTTTGVQAQRGGSGAIVENQNSSEEGAGLPGLKKRNSVTMKGNSSSNNLSTPNSMSMKQMIGGTAKEKTPSFSGNVNVSLGQPGSANLVKSVNVQKEIGNKEEAKIQGAGKSSGNSSNKIPYYEQVKKIKGYKLGKTLKKNNGEGNNIEDVKVLQMCLDILLMSSGQQQESEGDPSGQFGLNTENMVKSYQEKGNLQADGVVSVELWEDMIREVEKMEKKWMNSKEYMKQKEIDEMSKDREDLRKRMKDKQNKEASESLNKIESKLVDLSSLL